MDYEFDRAIGVVAQGSGQYRADLDPGWGVGPALNGGYLLAVIGNAVKQACAERGHPDPFTLSAHFVSAATPGPAWVELDTVRASGRFSTVTAQLVQEKDGAAVVRIVATATFGDLDRVHDDATDAAAESLGLALPAPPMPPREECVPTVAAPPEILQLVPLLTRFDNLLDPATAGWTTGEPSHQGRLQAWFSLADSRPLDPIALLMVVDALPPVTFDLGLFGWAPTLELTAHVRARPAPGWAIVRHATRTVAGGLFEEDCEVWDSTGRLVAQSRQLALQPR